MKPIQDAGCCPGPWPAKPPGAPPGSRPLWNGAELAVRVF
jgi:hypothetical protein